jgi:hypothetical protein
VNQVILYPETGGPTTNDDQFYWREVDKMVDDYKRYLKRKNIDMQPILNDASKLFSGRIDVKKDFSSDVEALVQEEKQRDLDRSPRAYLDSCDD